MTLLELTAKEQEVARHVANGLTNKTIAALLDVGERRVRVVVSAIAYKIGADHSKNERVQVANWYHANATVPKGHTA